MTPSPLLGSILAVFLCTTVLLLLRLSGRKARLSHTNRTSQFPGTNLKSFRVLNIPQTWTKDDLLNWIWQLDMTWDSDECRLSLYPSCFGQDQAAVLNMKKYPACFQDVRADQPGHFRIPGVEGLVLSVDIDFFDLTPLNSPEGHIVADVIAVTGLAGHAFGSWRNSVSEQMWLQDILPLDIRHVRIMTYGYHRGLSHPTDNSSILDFTRGFLQQLTVARSSDGARNRPLIFIGHSLGGTLILQLLIHSRNTPSQRHILDSTRAIFFFGAAHQGLRTEELEAMVMDLSEGAENANSRLLRQLRENSEFLERQRHDLVDIWEGFRVFSFYETELTETVKKSISGKYGRIGEPEEMVKKFSTQLYLRNEERIPIRGNHTQLVKFPSKGDPAYQVFLVHLKNCLSEIKAHNDPNMSYKEFLVSLRPPDYNSFRRSVVKPAAGTLTWFLGNPLFTSWRTGNLSTILSIRGSPGQGKTVLSNFILDDLDKQATTGISTVLYFFFYDRDQDKNLHTVNSLLRSLITQLLRTSGFQRFEGIPVTAEDCAKAIESNHALWEIFCSTVKKLDIKKVYLVIDGLDECEKGTEEGVQDLLRKLRDLLSNCTSPVVKILVTTRPLFHILDEMERFPFFDLKAHAEDLKVYVTESISKLPVRFKPRFRDRAVELLHAKAGNTFLWVSIIVKKLESLKIPTIDRIEKAINESSTNLNSLYKSIFDDIFRESEDEQKLVLWVAYGRRPLTLEELNAAIATQLDSSSNKSIQRFSPDLTPDGLTAALGIVLEIDNGVVRFIHQSAKDFVEERRFFVDLPLCCNLQPDAYIANVCITYLAFDEFDRICGDGDDIRKIKRDFPLLDYASRNWHVHTREFNDIICDTHDRLFQIIQPGSPKLRLWAAAAGISSDVDREHPLMMATKWNIEWLALHVLRKKDLRIKVTDDALRYALTYGSSAITNAALAASGQETIPHAMEWVASNKNSGKDAISGGLDGTQYITSNVVKEAAKNYVTGHEFMEGLAHSSNTEFTSDAIEAVAQLFGANEIQSILKKNSATWAMKNLLVAASMNERNGTAVLKELILFSDSIEIDGDIIEAAAKNKFCGKEIIAVLTGLPKVNLKDSAIENAIRVLDVEILEELILPKCRTITREIVLIAYERDRKSERIIRIILTRDTYMEITEAAVAAISQMFGKDVMELLLARDNIEITQAVVVAAARNNSKGIMELLLTRYTSIKITEAVMVAAAGSRGFEGKEIMELLLARDSGIKVTEAIMVAAAGNRSRGKRIIKLLLARDASIEITEAVLVAAAGSHGFEGKEVMKLLLDRDAEIKITEAIMVAAAGNSSTGTEIMKLLLDRDAGIEITEAVVVAAAGNNHRGKDLELLLARKADIEITEAVLVAAAGNDWRGDEIMKLLLARDPSTEITEAVVVAAATNGSKGNMVMNLLLARDPDIEITEAVVVAVTGNDGFGGQKIMQPLLNRNKNFGVHPASVIAAAYFGNLRWVKALLNTYTPVAPVEHNDQIVRAAVESGVVDILKQLLVPEKQYLKADEHNWTAYMIAQQSRNTWALQTFPGTSNSFMRAYSPNKWAGEYCAPIQLLGDGKKLLYIGKFAGMNTGTRCSIKSDHPFPPGTLGINYFEVTVKEMSSDSLYKPIGMGIGFCSEYILHNSLPIKYHFSSAYFSHGTCFEDTMRLNYDLPEYSGGSVVGCGIDWNDGSYFFSLDGEKIRRFPESCFGRKLISTVGTMRNERILRRRLYPLVVFYGKFEVQIEANFRGPFKYNLSQENNE